MPCGYFKDRNLSPTTARLNGPTSKYDPAAGNVQWLGLLYNQWLANVLLAMVKVPPAEFELWGHKGYGNPQLTKADVDPALCQALREHDLALFPDGEHGTAIPEGVRTHAAYGEVSLHRGRQRRG